eukprot:TRINITY_DN3435_c0_g4_i2.p1 TRINITY_DN3435_c0_g4~~TRINITY_DN3435_c0_g4_i2.p1  ORF type:complete len:799 (-),score=103.70 TRINITY_DN3435_c0_g4_i2:179-2575(-)
MHYYVTIMLFVITLGTYDPIQSISDVHSSLAQRYDVGRLNKLKDVQSVTDYLDFFIKRTYKMGSAMIDVNTFDSIDPARCFDPDVTDICQLTYWSVLDTNPSALNYINKTEMIDMSIGRVGLHLRRPVVLDSRMDYPTPMVVPLAPLVWQTRAKRVPCSGFGNVYNDEVLGAGRCPLDGECPENTAVSYFAGGKSNQRIYLTYVEPAFFCVDHDIEDGTFYDRSWYPGAFWEDLQNGRKIETRVIGGTSAFAKFVSNIAYLQAPINLEVGSDRLTATDPLWTERSVSNNPRRAQCVKEYITSAENDRKNTFVTLETKSLTAVAIVIIPQGEKMPDMTTIAMAKFEFSPYGRVSARMEFNSTSQPPLSWQVTAVVFWIIALIGVIDNGQRHVRHWNDPVITTPKILRVSDVVLPLAAIIHIIVVFYEDLSPPHVDEDLKAAFSANEERRYIEVVGVIINYANVHARLRVAGFFICVLFVFRAILQLELHPKFALLLNALQRCKGDLWHILLACAPIFFVMGFQTYWMFATNHESKGFGTIFSAMRTTLTFVMPGIPGTVNQQDITMFVMWGLTGLFVLRLFYLVTIASIVKAFMGAKDAVGQNAADRDIQVDALDAFTMMFYRFKHKWPMPGRILKNLQPGMKQRLKNATAGVPNAVTPSEMASLLALPEEEAKNMLRHYASKLLDEHGSSVLIEKNKKLRFAPGLSATSDAAVGEASSREAAPASKECERTLTPELAKILDDFGVTAAVSTWLLDHGIIDIDAFADLAESKGQIVDVVGRPAGLDPSNALQTQPLKTT